MGNASNKRNRRDAESQRREEQITGGVVYSLRLGVSVLELCTKKSVEIPQESLPAAISACL